MLRKLALVCGIASSAVYVSYDLTALRWSGYDPTAQAISELFAIGAPSQPLALRLGFAYDLLLLAFAAGVADAARGRRTLRIAANLLAAVAILGFVWPPMHLRGDPTTLSDALHVAFAGVISLLIFAAVGFAAAAFGRRFRLYSIVTAAVMLLFGGLSGTLGPRIPENLPTPWLGVFERIDLGAYLLWVVILAALLITETRAPRRSGARAAAGYR